MGGKAGTRRNFENGILTDSPDLVNKMMEQFDGVWRGAFCPDCGRKEYCCEFDEILG
jgi:MoaA/NifB/PqqE/SkfB family radical SAM enzyme